jgi:hypothetical protein
MNPMKHTTSDWSTATDPRRTLAESVDRDKRDTTHFESLRVPSLMSVPLFTAWLRKPFRRKATHS